MFENSRSSAENDQSTGLTTTIATGIGVALLAPELLPGMAVGVAAMLAPRVWPLVGGVVRSIVKTGVELGYAAASKTQEVISETSEDIEDLAAEARAVVEGDKRSSVRSRSNKKTGRVVKTASNRSRRKPTRSSAHAHR